MSRQKSSNPEVLTLRASKEKLPSNGERDRNLRQSILETENQFAAFIGIDRSDRYLDVCLQAADSRTPGHEHSRIASAPEAVAQWIAQMTARFPGGTLAICVEQPAVALLEHLAHWENVVLFPINPLTLARYREAFTTSRAKDDASDAASLLELVVNHRDKLPVWRPDNAETRSIVLLCEGRRKAIDLCTRLCNALLAHLKSYFPQALELCGNDLHSVLSCEFLSRWPSLQKVKRSQEKTLRAFYNAHNCRSRVAIDNRLALIKSSVAVSDDQALLRGSIPTTQMYAGQLKALSQSIAEFDKELKKLLKAHEDASVFDSLPGAGPVHSARLLAAFGSDRERYENAADMQKYSGIAPVVKASGKVRLVQRRFARPLFMHQSFMEYSGQSILHCA